MGERNPQNFSVHIAWVRFEGAKNLLFQGGGCNSKGEQISSECEERMDIWTDVITCSNADISLPGFQQVELLEAVASSWQQIHLHESSENSYTKEVWDGFFLSD